MTFDRTYYRNATGPAEWIAKSDLALDQADTTIIFIAHNSMRYRKQITDPVFQATYALQEATSTAESRTTYYPDDPVAVVACAEQYQICNPMLGQEVCTAWTGRVSIPTVLEDLDLNQAQTITATRLMYMVTWANLWSSVNGLGPNALRMYDTAYQYIIESVPQDQWRLEVDGWFETTLAKWQAFTMEYAFLDPAALGNHGHLTFPIPINASMQEAKSIIETYEGQCANQRIRNTGSYQNVPILYFAIIWALGGLIWLVSLFAANVVSSCSTRRMAAGREGFRQKQRRLAYVADGKLQLQRMAIHNSGCQHPILLRGEGDVPVFETLGKNSILLQLEDDDELGLKYSSIAPGAELLSIASAVSCPASDGHSPSENLPDASESPRQQAQHDSQVGTKLAPQVREHTTSEIQPETNLPRNGAVADRDEPAATLHSTENSEFEVNRRVSL